MTTNTHTTDHSSSDRTAELTTGRGSDHGSVPAWPAIRALTRADGSGEVTINGTSHPVTTTSLDDARAQVIVLVAQTASRLGRPVRLLTSGPDGDWPLIVHPDGTVEADTTAPAPRSRTRAARTRPTTAATGSSAPAAIVETTDEPAGDAAAPMPPQDRLDAHPTTAVVDLTDSHTDTSSVADAAPAAPPAATGSHREAPQGWLREPAPSPDVDPAQVPRTRREARRSFLTEQQLEEPATYGVRGLLARAGVQVSPSAAERAQRADADTVSRHWPGPRTIAVVNGKGGAGKTPTTVLLAAVFARHGGAGVLTWDNNQTRGTLGWRTEQGPHEATLLDLLPQVDRLLGTSAQSADLAHYVHHQTRDRFDVLRSKPMALADEQRVEPADVDAIHAVAAKYYRLIFLDSGNDESDPMWRRMIDHTDQLVVATTTRDDHAEAGALLLEALAERDEHSATLAANAVAVVTQAEPRASTASVQRVADGYRPLTRAAVTIPFDPAMVDGVLHYNSLRASTQRAWLAAGAAVAGGL